MAKSRGYGVFVSDGGRLAERYRGMLEEFDSPKYVEQLIENKV